MQFVTYCTGEHFSVTLFRFTYLFAKHRLGHDRECLSAMGMVKTTFGKHCCQSYLAFVVAFSVAQINGKNPGLK